MWSPWRFRSPSSRPASLSLSIASHHSQLCFFSSQCGGSKSAAVALERVIDLGWSFAVLVVVVVASSSWSPLWASSSSRPRLRRRSPVLRWTFAFLCGWPPISREGHTLCDHHCRRLRRRRRLSLLLASSLRSTDRWDGVTVSSLIRATAPFISRILLTSVVVAVVVVLGVLVLVLVVSALAARRLRRELIVPLLAQTAKTALLVRGPRFPLCC